MALLRKQLSSRSFKSSRTTNIQYPKHSSHPSGSITEFVWKDYSPTIFRNIQELGHVSHEEYMQSVCNQETLMELAIRGCCAKPFNASHDDRFVIKTLRKSEAKVLLEMLPSYYNHLQKNENSLLAKCYGLHASRPGTGGMKIYFVVMENLLRTDMQIHKRYDLKGSTKGRNATYRNGSQTKGSQQRLTLKDLEFDLCFYLDQSMRSQILEQIKIDCKYLEEQGIMDYSLLLGIHVENARRDSSRRCTQDDSVQIDNGTNHTRDEIIESFHRRDPTFSYFAADNSRLDFPRFGAKISARSAKMRRSDYKGSPSDSMHKSRSQESNNVCLFIGIIDFLQNYSVMKRLEHAYKSLQYDSKTISSVNPKLYASRFQDFLSKVFLVEELGSPDQSQGSVDANTTSR